MVGQTLSHYRVTARIGAGGMGEVYLAEDLKLDRQVALKVLGAGFAGDETSQRRFAREAKAASALSHPNVAQVYEIDESGGVHFIAMEYIEGRTLSEMIREGPLSAEQVASIARQSAEGLAAAHRKGIVHRDIKPSNIMVDPDGLVKILDFGLAKRAGAADTPQTLTEADVIAGTVAYMSPEQATGKPLDVGTDLFSWGAMMYEAAAGAHPFRAAQAFETVGRILSHPPEPLREKNPALPAELANIVHRCLEKDRGLRYPSAVELAAELLRVERGLAGAPPAAPARAPAARIPGQRKRAIAAGAVLAAACAGAYYTYRHYSTAAEPRSVAILPFENTGGDANTEYLSDGITENLIISLAQAPNLAVRSRGSVFVYKGKRVDPAEAARALKVEALVTGKVAVRGPSLTVAVELVDGRNRQLWGEQYAGRPDTLQSIENRMARDLAQRLRARMSGEDGQRIRRRYTANNEAYELYLRGRYFYNKRTSESARRALEMFQQAAATDPGFALAHAGVADCYVLQSGLSPPTEVFPKARQAAKQAIDLDDTVAEAHASVAHIAFYFDWDWTVAEQEYKRAMDLGPSYSPAYSAYGRFLGAMGRFEEAIAAFERAVELDPLSHFASTGLGGAYALAGRHERAMTQLRKTVETEPEYGLAYVAMGEVYARQGLFADAIREYERALTLLGPDAGVMSQLGCVYARSGKAAEARKMLAKLRESSKQRHVLPPFFSYLHAALGEKDEAIEYLERGYAERSYPLVFLKVYPLYDPLRDDPRFAALLERMRLK